MFDVKDDGLTDFQKNLQYLITNMPKETKSVLQKVGTKARTIVARQARQIVKKKTGNYHKSFKRGKVWQENDGTYKVRVYNNSPHAHLLENGWMITGKDGSQHGFKVGYKVMQKSEKELEKEWDQLLESEIDKLIDKL